LRASKSARARARARARRARLPSPPRPLRRVVEIDFAPGLGSARGLREIARSDWDLILADAKCTVLATLSSDTVDSYVLSESSLFVYPRKVIIKTCGTTTLLMALPRLLAVTQVRSPAARSRTRARRAPQTRLCAQTHTHMRPPTHARTHRR